MFAFHSLSLIAALGSTHFSITYIFIFQWVLKEFQGRARDRECSWRLPPPGNYVTPWFNSSWHFSHCTFCSSSKYIPLRKRRHLPTTQDNRGDGCSWSCVDLKQKQKQKLDKQNVGTCSMRSPEHKKVGSGTSKVPGVSLQTPLRQGRGFIFHF